MIRLDKETLNKLPEATKLHRIRAVYLRNGVEMPWASHTGIVSKDTFERLKDDLTQDKTGLRWYGRLITA